MGLAAGCIARSNPTAPIPEPETWPLQWYGPRNTARSPDATPPTDPEVQSVDTTVRPGMVVVGGRGSDRRVVGGGDGGVTAHRADGGVAWEHDHG